MGKSNKKLKVALQSQQSRLKEKDRIIQAAQLAQQRQKQKSVASTGGGSKSKSSSSKSKGHNTQPTRRPTIPFKPTDKILLVGEGDFSFARALVVDPPSGSELSYLPPGNITATAYDSEVECYEKYPRSQEIVETLRQLGVEVLFGVDATRLERLSSLKGRKWDRIVWNFPHAGKGITDQDRNILSNQVLLLGFLRSAAKLLVEGPVPTLVGKGKQKATDDDESGDEHGKSKASTSMAVEEDPEDQKFVQTFTSPEETVRTRGTILITLRNVPPYTLWDLPRLAKKPPLPTGSTPPNPHFTLLRSFAFVRSLWKGYEHRMTKGERANGTGRTGEGGEDRTWEFHLRD
ncbi:hypothetical protein BDN72DRAFT_896446 [Pluteus cervinus]|uniref:Uncharacterized protein n=1 Tax=Pluteus cervinus TaxID=181527 RepID=A0ACD3AXI6_9AGAR|nr:hypothetical protein BDN72DRAFT_896446 [Pluteus cervinus]